jgi:polysaccharide pyruvyl transferase WcaK-like protein
VIVVLHAFSRRNAGDGLLVDLTLERLERIGIARADCCVVALDADSFADLPCARRAPGDPWRRASFRVVAAAAGLGLYRLSGGRIRPGELRSLVDRADGIVGIGGGYLHSETLVEAMGSLLNHGTQLALASRSKAPSVYLPQSIGPLPGRTGRMIGRLLSGIDLVCVRDDLSRRDLDPYLEASRVPDLAILQLAASLPEGPGRVGDRILLVGRALSGDRAFETRLRAVAGMLPGSSWAVQADALGRKSDREFYRRLGVHATGPLTEALAAPGGGVVVSVRLHGALQSLLAGWPAVHLSYDRKGWGAYQDLGLEAFVHDAHDFDPNVVAAQARAILAEPARFWESVLEQRPALLAASDALTEELRRRLRASDRRTAG